MSKVGNCEKCDFNLICSLDLVSVSYFLLAVKFFFVKSRCKRSLVYCLVTLRFVDLELSAFLVQNGFRDRHKLANQSYRITVYFLVIFWTKKPKFKDYAAEISLVAMVSFLDNGNENRFQPKCKISFR